MRNDGKLEHLSKLLLLFHNPVHNTVTQLKNSRKPWAAQDSQAPLDEGNDCEDAQRAPSTVAALLCKNNQQFRERDLKKSRDKKNFLLAKSTWDTGELDSGLCSELEQDVNKSASGEEDVL